MNYRDIDLAEGQRAVFNITVTAPAGTDTTLTGGVTVRADDGSETDYLMEVDGEKLTAGTLPVGRHVYEIRSGGRTVVYGFLVVHPSPLAGETGGAQWQIVGDIGVADIDIDIIDGMKGDTGDITPDLETLKTAAETAATAAASSAAASAASAKASEEADVASASSAKAAAQAQVQSQAAAVAAGEAKTAAESSAAAALTAASNSAASATFAESAATSATAAAEAAQAAASEIAGQLSTKANADFDNVTSAGKEEAMGWSMPDYSAGVSITSGYTVTQKGVISAVVLESGKVDSQYWSLSINGIVFAYEGGSYWNVGSFYALVNKGDVITWSKFNKVIFYPLKGN